MSLPQLKSSKPWVHLGVQSVLPSFPPQNCEQTGWELSQDHAYCGSWSLAISRRSAGHKTTDTKTSPQDEVTDGFSPSSVMICPLYKLNLHIREDTVLDVKYIPTNMTGESGIYLDISPPDGSPKTLRKFIGLECSQGIEHKEWKSLRILRLWENLQLRANFRGSTIVELGVYSDASPDLTGCMTNLCPTPTTFVYLGQIAISRAEQFSEHQINAISTHISPDGTTWLSWKTSLAQTTQQRDEARTPDQLLSKTTGSFAYFMVYSGQEMLGLAFTTEYKLDKSFIKRIQGQVSGTEYSVQGVMWDGRVVASALKE